MIHFPFAKINLGLNIVSRRTDGFHNIETVFYPIRSLYDILEIVPSNTNTQFTPSGINIPDSGGANLCVQAYELLKKDFNLPSVSIYLHKCIPMGAGLGGGSADATFTLINLNQQFNLQLTEEKLCCYAQQLGSDCAFFVTGKTSWAQGRGEILNPINLDLSDYYVIVVSPEIHISTAHAYAGVRPKKSESDWSNLNESTINDWKYWLKNDFETSIFHLHPEIARIKHSLYDAGALYSAMSGSGSSVYGIFKQSVDLSTFWPSRYAVYKYKL